MRFTPREEKKTKQINVFGVDLLIKEVSWRQFVRFNEAYQAAKKEGKTLDEDAMLNLIMGSVFTLDGQKAFADEDKDWLADQNPNTVSNLVADILELSNPPEDEDAKKN